MGHRTQPGLHSLPQDSLGRRFSPNFFRAWHSPEPPGREEAGPASGPLWATSLSFHYSHVTAMCGGMGLSPHVPSLILPSRLPSHLRLAQCLMATRALLSTGSGLLGKRVLVADQPASALPLQSPAPLLPRPSLHPNRGTLLPCNGVRAAPTGVSPSCTLRLGSPCCSFPGRSPPRGLGCLTAGPQTLPSFPQRLGQIEFLRTSVLSQGSRLETSLSTSCVICTHHNHI